MNRFIRIALLLVAPLFAISANAAPMAYSVNSDSVNGDSLYLIDLATGVDQLRGKLFTGIEDRTDTEGLAFSSDPQTLWGMDDASGTLFPINPVNGSINYEDEIQLPLEFRTGGGNDFGMTFACDKSLYFTSVKSNTLYRRDENGSFEAVGSDGSLAVSISAVAAKGFPVKLYGLGNGQFQDGVTDSPNLYIIDTETGVASMVGPLSETGEFKYNEAGLAFDSDGSLWAITDRSQLNNQKSQILRINTVTGAATLVSTTLNELGYESLAIGPPTNCDGSSQFEDESLPRIPTYSLTGRLSSILVLMLAGMLFLRRRYN